MFVRLLSCFLLLSSVVFSSDQFPLRKEFPNVTPIELSDLQNKYNEVTIIDVRSKFEYDVVHIQKAIHIPMNNKKIFLETLLATRAKNGKVPLVFYCNGIKCKKSYEAYEYASQDGFKNIFCFDSGVISWLKANPTKSFLLGKTPADPKKVISHEDFEKHMVTGDVFKQAGASADNMIFDVRDATQREKNLDVANIKMIPLDNLLPSLKKGLFKDKKLYFMDAVGKQVEWLQYYLQEYGYSNYWFLKGGVDGS
jgi:rhodanese-related sulfurtransferase